MKKILTGSFLLFSTVIFAQSAATNSNVINVKNVTDLRTLAPTDTNTVYNLLQKGKRGFWRYDAGDVTSPDNTGTIIVTNSGKRFKREIPDGILHLDWFNVYANGTSNDKPGFDSALAYYKRNTNRINWLQLGQAEKFLTTYRFNDTIRIDFNADIRGGNNSVLVFGNNKAGLKLRSSETTTFIPTIYLSGLKIHQDYSSETFNSNENGIEINCIAHLKDITVTNFQGNGVLMWGNAGTNPPTNCDLSTLEKVVVILCRGNGFLIYGADANIIDFKDCQAISCGGAGWLDNSFLGNSYNNCQTASCSSPELFFQRGLCKYGGLVYYAKHNGNNRGIKTKLGRPDISSNDWGLISDQTWIQYSYVKTWNADSSYLAGGGFLLDIDNASGQNQRGTLLSCYTEMDSPPSYLGYACMAVGGNIGSVARGLRISSWFGLLELNNGIKVSDQTTFQSTFQRSNAFAWVKRLGELKGAVNVYDTTNNFLSWYDWETYDPSLISHSHGGNFILPTQNTPASYFGRSSLSSTSYFTPFVQEMYLNNRSGTGNHHKRIYMAEAPPSVSASDMTGDIIFNSITGAGNNILGWRKTGDGATGSWEAMRINASQAAGSSTSVYAAKTSNYTATVNDYSIDCTKGTFTVTLPTAAGIQGHTYVIKNSGTGIITVAAASSQTIDGKITYPLSVQYKYVTLQSTGENWIVIGNN